MRHSFKLFPFFALPWSSRTLPPLSRIAVILCVCAASAPSQTSTDPNDKPNKILSQPDPPNVAYLKTHPGAVELAHASGKLRFRHANGTQTAIFGPVTHQDPKSGAWVPNAPTLSETNNGWRFDNSASTVMIRKNTQGNVLTQTYTDFTSKKDSVVTLALPVLTYDKGFSYHFVHDGLPWNLTVDQTGGFSISSTVSHKRGPRQYSFALDSSERLAADATGQLAGDGHVLLSRAVLIPKIGKPIPCSAWSWSKKDGATFTCDDSGFRNSQLPYVIDPTVTMWNPGPYWINRTIAKWAGNNCDEFGENCYWDSGEDRADYDFGTYQLIPPGNMLVEASCGFPLDVYNSYPGLAGCTVGNFDNNGGTHVQAFINYNPPTPDTSFNYSEIIYYITLTVTWQPYPNTTVASSPSGLTLTVDGNSCYSSCTYQWSPGSSHTISASSPQGSGGTQFVLSGWSDSGGQSHSISAPSSDTTYTANFATQYYLTTAIAPSSSGSISPASQWLNAGAVQNLSASANSGYQFGSFSGGLSGGTTPQNVTMNGPVTVTANFNVSHTVTSSPSGRSLTVDGAACNAPCVVYWAPGSSHTVAAATQAGATGTQYVWSSWSDSGAASHSVTASSSPATYTANFTTQYYLTTSAGTGGSISPAGGWYNTGSVVSVSASANGGYYFAAFTGALTGATTPQNVTMSAPQTVTANFSGLQTITSTPAGRTLSVDGANCTTPCSYSWTANSPHTINVATTTQAGATGIQYVFGSWSDSGATSHNITAASTPTTWTANFTTQYFLTTSASPAAAGSIAPGSGWYNSGASVSVSASANTSYQFATFSNGLTGSTNPQSVTMNAPVTVTANFNVAHTIRSSPAGLSLTVDSSGCTDPCVVYWSPGSSHTIAASTNAGATGTQYVWASWSDSLAASHGVTAASSPATFTASFTTQYYLTTAASPSAGGAITPASGWYNSGATPSVAASANANYQFTSFTGDLTGATSPQTVTMSAPRSVTANFLAVQTVTSVPTGRTVTVDSVACTTPCTFSSWALNSTHTIAAAGQSGATGTQYVFANWSDSGAASHSITVGASATTYTATFTTQYYLTTTAGAGGTITPASGWYNSGATPSVAATPNSGYAFTAFTGDLTGATTPQTVTMSAPRSVTAGFIAVQTVTSVPTGRTLTVDGSSCTTPCTFQNWAANSTHTIVAADQSGATGTQYLFANWSDSGAASHTITAAATPATFTATFTTQYYLTTATSPSTGGTITPASGWYNSGATPTVAATANTGYQFANFSGGTTASTSPQTVTMSGPVTVTANFNVGYTIGISPSTLAFTVDGAACATPPCSYWWSAASFPHTIAAAATQAGATGVQYVFANWSDGGAASHTVTATTPATITANFTTQYYLTTAASPSAGGTITPASGWQNAGATPAVSATTNSLYQFTGFTGALTGTTTPQNVTMNAPVAVTANFISAVPVWSITSQHSGNFAQGQTGATYTVTVSNQAAAYASSGTVTLTDAPTAGLTITALAGTGWTCTVSTATCTRGDSLAPGASYPAITVTVTVAANATSPQGNQATVSGGGGASVTSANDATTISGPPTSLLASPPAAFGHHDSFNFTWSDPASNTNITGMQVQFSNSNTQTANSCWVRVDRTAGTIYLRGDNGVELAPVPFTSTTPVHNSQCAVYPSLSSVSGSNFLATLNLNMAFYESYAGPRTMWMKANNGVDSAWANPGSAVYTITDQNPTVDGVSPSSGRGWTQTFAFTGTDLDGATDLTYAQVMFNNPLSASSSCFIIVSLSFNGIYLADDAGNLQGPLIAHQAGTLSNSQCSIDGSGSSVSARSGNSVTVNLAMTFSSTYAGAQTIWTKADDAANVESGWTNRGAWTVGPLQDYTISATPAAAAVVAGNPTQYAINLTAINGFNSAVTLSASGLPTGGSVQFGSFNNGTATMTVSTATSENGGPVGEYDIVVSGASSGLVRTTTVHLSVQNFVVTIAPPTMDGECSPGYWVAKARSSSNDPYEYPVYTATVNGVNGYTGTVNFPIPSIYNGPNTTNPANLSWAWTSNPSNVSANGGTALLTTSPYLNSSICNTSNWLYTFLWQVYASGGVGPASHAYTAQMTLKAPRNPAITMTVTAPTNQIIALPNGTAVYPIQVTSQFGFTNAANVNITFSATSLPTGWSAYFNPATVSIAAGVTSYSQLVLTPPSSGSPSFASFGIIANSSNSQIAGASSQTFTVTVAAPQAQVVVHTNPEGLYLTTDVQGQQRAPYTYPLPTNGTVTVTAQNQISQTDLNTQYVFTGWSDSNPNNPRTFNGAATVTANFKAQYKLTTTATGGGAISLSPAPDGQGGWYDEKSPATQVTLTAVPTPATPPAYYFVGWSQDLSGTGSPQTLTMNRPHSATATFAAIGTTTVPITTSPANVPITIDGQRCSSNCLIVMDGGSHRITVQTENGPTDTRYVFKQWPNGTTTGTFWDFTPTSNGTYVVTFDTQFLLRMTINPTGGGIVSAQEGAIDTSGRWYLKDASVVLTPAASSGNRFINFTGGTVTNNSITMSAPVSLTANFGALSTVKEYIRINGRIIAIENKQ